MPFRTATPSNTSAQIPVADRVMSLFSWGRVSFLVILAMAGFGTFVAGEVSGARTLEPRVVALEEKIDAFAEDFEDRGKTLYEIKGYVKAIAVQMGVPQHRVEDP